MSVNVPAETKETEAIMLLLKLTYSNNLYTYGLISCIITLFVDILLYGYTKTGALEGKSGTI